MATLNDQRIQYENKLKDLLSALGSGTGSNSGSGGTILDSRLSIINFVKAKLDELIPEGEGVTFKLSDSPNISDPYNLLINAHLDEATKDVILGAPLSVLVPIKDSVTTGTPFASGSLQGYVSLPNDFLRLSQFKMADWERIVEIPITPTDPLYKSQSNEFLRGGTAKPVAVLSWRNNSGTVVRILEYYSVLNTHNVERLFYHVEKTAEDFISVNPNLLPSLAWMCAGKIMQILGLQIPMQMAMEQVKLSYLNL